MNLPTRDFYGNRMTDEVFRLEVGPRVANCYDEAFAIEGRMIRAGLCVWRGPRQTEWQTAARVYKLTVPICPLCKKPMTKCKGH